MKKIILALFVMAATQTSFCQEFTNKLWKQPVSKSSTCRLDYFSNWKTLAGEMKTSVYFSYIPRPGFSPFHAISGWKTVKLRDKATGKEYKVINGNGITLRNDAVFAFHTGPNEIGFSLDFELMPSTVRDIDIIFLDDKWFSDVHLDPEQHYNNNIFRLNYILRTVSFYTTVKSIISFNLDNTVQSDIVIRNYYESPNKPADCAAGGTLTLAFPIEEQEQQFKIWAYCTLNGSERRWEFSVTPAMGCELISLSSGE